MNARIAAALIAAGATLGLAASAGAQPSSMRAGLWEVKMQNPQMDAALARMNEQLAAMPPAQRQQMEQMFKSRGMNLGERSIRVCVTPEMVKRGPEAPSPREGCDQKLTWHGRVGKFEMVCKDGSTGRGEIDYKTDTAYDGWMQFDNPKRPQESMRMTMRGTWIAKDCGSVKPVPMR